MAPSSSSSSKSSLLSMNSMIIFILSSISCLSRIIFSQEIKELTYKDLFEKEKIFTDHLKVENILLKEQYGKISSEFHRILHKHSRIFGHIENEIKQLKMKINDINIHHSQTTFFYTTAPLLILTLFIVVSLLCLICGRINQQEPIN